MNRSPWSAVLWTVLVLVGTTLASYLPWNRVAPSLMHATSIVASRETGQLRAWIEEQRFVMALNAIARPAQRPIPAVWLGGSVALALGLIALFVLLAVRARRQRLRVLNMARRGNAMNAIARDNRLSQDAVRLLLSPMIDPSRARVRSGKFFRSAAVPAAARPARASGHAAVN